MMRPRKMSAMRFMSSRSFSPAFTLISISSRSMCCASDRSTTFTTSISLFSCLVICSTTSSDPEVTMVMRDIEASSVGATVSDSMLYPRAENNPAIRDRAPASFSTRIEMMCRINSQLFGQDDLGDALAARDHRVHVLGLVGDEVEEYQLFLVGEGLAQLRLHVRRLLHQHAAVPVGFREPHEVGQRVHVGFGIAVAVEELLPLAHHAHVFVIQVDDLDRQPVLLAGGELLYAHLDRGLAGDARHGRAGIGHLHAHRRRQAEAHRAEAAGVDPAARLLELVELRGPHLMLSHIGGDEGVAPGHFIELLEHELRLDDLRVAVVLEAIARAPFAYLLPP